MKLSTAAILLASPAVLAFAPQRTAFRPSSSLFATPATEEKKVRRVFSLPTTALFDTKAFVHVLLTSHLLL